MVVKSRSFHHCALLSEESCILFLETILHVKVENIELFIFLFSHFLTPFCFPSPFAIITNDITDQKKVTDDIFLHSVLKFLIVASIMVLLKMFIFLIFGSFLICRRRHKSDCLCAICVLKRRKRECEANARLGKGQSGVQELKQEVCYMILTED